jgi:hypothetical protein
LRFVAADLPLGPVLVFLAILTCLLLLGHVRDVSHRRTAEEKGLALLKQWLSPAQLTQYEKYHYFEVTGGDSGKHYRIRPTRQMNVDELDQHWRADDFLLLWAGRGASSWRHDAGPEDCARKR